MENPTNDWNQILHEQLAQDYYIELKNKLIKAYQVREIYPPQDQIFTALQLTPYNEVKVVILGQDPYHGHGQAHGLAFSVPPGVRIPPSLLNIYKELNSDLNCFIPDNGYLSPWAQQGVLLLNTIMTVEANKPNSHNKIGWESFTDNIIKQLNLKETPIVFMLWGNHAKSKEKLITNNNHLVLKTVHPSPLSANRGFMGCKHFSQTNQFLELHKQTKINWQIPNLFV